MTSYNSRSEVIRLINQYAIHKHDKADIELSSGIMTDVYLDLKPLLLMPVFQYHVGYLLSHYFFSWDVDGIGGPSDGGILTANCYTRYMWRTHSSFNLFYTRNMKTHGANQNTFVCSPELKDNAGVVVVDDVISTGNSLLNCLSHVYNRGYKIIKTMVIVDREMGGVSTVLQNNFDCEVLIKMSELNL